MNFDLYLRHKHLIFGLFFEHEKIDWHLKNWKEKRSRKPLLLKGVRQIGKTFSVRELGKQFESFVEINEKSKPLLGQKQSSCISYEDLSYNVPIEI